MALAENDLGNGPGFGGRHAVILPIGTVAGVYEISVSPGKRINIVVGNAGTETFDHVYFNFSEEEAAFLKFPRTKAVIEAAIVEIDYSAASLVGMRTVGIELFGTTLAEITIEVVESKL